MALPGCHLAAARWIGDRDPIPDPRTPLSPTARSTVRRGAGRARTDRAELYAVLDAGLVCHLGIVLDGAPVVLPTVYGRASATRSTCTAPPAPAPCAPPRRAHRSA